MAAVMVTWIDAGPDRHGAGLSSLLVCDSIALSVGFVVAYPINWWLVDWGLKHGMMTVRPAGEPMPLAAGLSMAGAAMSGSHGMTTQPRAAPRWSTR